MKHLLFSFLTIIFLTTCSKDPITALGVHNLKVKEGLNFESGLFLEITSVEDSRCPLDAVCVWAGEAVVTFNVTLGAQSEIIQLGKCVDPGSQCKPAKVEMLNHSFELIEVSPFPKADAEVKEGDWIVRMSVEEL